MFIAEDTSSKLRLDQLTLSLEACPVLAKLAKMCPIYIAECVLKLLHTAKLCALNNPLNEPQGVISHLDDIAINVPRGMLIQFVLSPIGLSSLPVLVSMSTCFF